MSYSRYTEKPKAHQIDSLRKDRLAGFISKDQWQGINLLSVLYKKRYSDLSIEVYSAPNLDRPSFQVATTNSFKPTSVGESFGPSWSTHWFRITIDVPEYEDSLEFHWDSNSEGMIWTEDGEPLHGLTGGHRIDRRVEFIIPKSWKGKKSFYVEASMNGMFGCANALDHVPAHHPANDIIQPPNQNRLFLLDMAELVEPNALAWDLYWDFVVISDVARTLPMDSWEAQKCLGVANDVVNAFRRNDPTTLSACRSIAKKVLGAVQPEEKRNTIVTAIGHCHIDTAWLWPFGETKRKIARSWATQVDLMNRYPEHHFAASQAQQYKWLKQDYPSLFRRVAEKIKGGQFIPLGGSWVENDTNFPSGESLCRQLIYGQRFFQKEFGIRCKIFWLPDTFGYASQLPQLLRLAGMPYFFTQKMSWNNINKYPNTTFNWVGLDNSQVLSHMAPTETYNAQVTAAELKMSITNHGNLAEDNQSLLLFGNGDGGGGPLAGMLERARRFEALSDTVGGLPRVAVTDSVDRFFEGIEERTRKGQDLVTWHGELYLEFHRGTYTSQASTKHNNRRAENFLRETEYLNTLAFFLKGQEYPNRVLDEMWEDVLLCQFHDVLPGSCIEMVYEDTAVIYAAIMSKGRDIYEGALKALGFGGEDQSVLNTLAWPRSEVIKVDDVSGFARVQKSQGGGFIAVGSDGLGATKVVDLKYAPASAEERDGVFVLKNDQLQVTIKGGAIVSLIDLGLGKELVPEGKLSNRTVLFDDQPLYWDAWDVEVHHLEKFDYVESGKVTIVENGPLRASLKVEQKISKDSWMTSIISLDAVLEGQSYTEGFNDALSLIHVECEVEWQEDRKFLKVEFPWNLHNSTADYETQFGIIRRPTHFNTTWDSAKFEVVCHKFANLDEFGYGVAILNDSKYGFSTHGNTQRLSLLRSSKAPDAHADMGRQKFRYGILPHRGSLNQNAIVKAGFNFNSPLRLVAGFADLPKFAVIEAPNVVLETIKKSEDGSDLVIRAYEAYGGAAIASIDTSLRVNDATKVNLLEEKIGDLEVKRTSAGSSVSVAFKAFEVITLRLTTQVE
ncbi:Glycoside hydrolase, 38 vacuolar alpha mannosidase [Hypocenomyce scalaris]|nr:Glycoside hydrolase, 38 vacuolar alpha mannosidase [Hypocenomyce scalaris]